MRYDLISPRKKKDGSTFWHRVGTAFPRDSGGFALMFDSLPLPDAEGKVYVMMSEAKERDSAPQGGGAGRAAQDTQRAEPGTQRGAGGLPEDEIPFAMEWRV